MKVTKDIDEGDVSGAAQAGFAVVCLLPCAIIWNACIAPSYLCSGDILPMGVGVIGTLLSIVPMIIIFIVTAIVTAIPGVFAAGIGALGRKIKLW
jgi:hypothetical protein